MLTLWKWTRGHGQKTRRRCWWVMRLFCRDNGGTMPTIKMIITLSSSLITKKINKNHRRRHRHEQIVSSTSTPPPPWRHFPSQYLSPSVTLIMHFAPHDQSIKIFNHLAWPRTVQSNEAGAGAQWLSVQFSRGWEFVWKVKEKWKPPHHPRKWSHSLSRCGSYCFPLSKPLFDPLCFTFLSTQKHTT